MPPSKSEFGRRGRPVVTHRPPGSPDPGPPNPKRKRTIGISLVAAGALAAAATYQLERASGETCVPDPAHPAALAPPAGTALAPAAVTTGGAIGDATSPCPPGTKRQHVSGGSHRSSSGWRWSSWSSSSSSSGSHADGGSSASGLTSVGHTSSSATARGGFGSLGSFHASGGS